MDVHTGDAGDTQASVETSAGLKIPLQCLTIELTT